MTYERRTQQRRDRPFSNQRAHALIDVFELSAYARQLLARLA
jgi:hypothetical protein